MSIAGFNVTLVTPRDLLLMTMHNKEEQPCHGTSLILYHLHGSWDAYKAFVSRFLYSV